MSSSPPRVFLLPGIGGDEQSLVDFRASMADRVDFQLLDYPDVDRPSSEIRDFDRIVSHIVGLVGRLQPTGDLQIVGYSFGGQLAFAAACKLQESGRHVRLLAILDSRAPTLRLPGSSARVSNSDGRMSLSLAAADLGSRLLIASGLSELVRAAIRPTGALLGNGARERLRRLLLQNLRGRSLRQFKPGWFDGPLLLFRAREQLIASLPPVLGWSAHCTEVRSVELHGGHNSLFGAEHLAENTERIWLEIRRWAGRSD